MQLKSITFFIILLSIYSFNGCFKNKSSDYFKIYNESVFDKYFKIDKIERVEKNKIRKMTDQKISGNISNIFIYHLISNMTGNFIEVELYYFTDPYYIKKFLNLAEKDFIHLPGLKKNIYSDNEGYYFFEDFCYLYTNTYIAKIIFLQKTDNYKTKDYNNSALELLLSNFFGLKK
ncbi:hypothetical protein KA977_01795 [Candidatus Dependentiae bacterium]|nr:hypothetical protein [Candidatus Dependentiae bacterium]